MRYALTALLSLSTALVAQDDLSVTETTEGPQAASQGLSDDAAAKIRELEAQIAQIRDEDANRVTWAEEVTYGTGTKTEAVIVTSPSCIYCPIHKAYLKSLGYDVREISSGKCFTEFGFRPSRLPCTIRPGSSPKPPAPGKYVGKDMYYGHQKDVKVIKGVLGPAETLPSERVVRCNIPRARNIEDVVRATVTHLTTAEGELAVGGLFDFDGGKIPTTVTDLVAALCYDNAYEINEWVILTWDAAGFTANDGVIQFNSPINIRLNKGPFKVGAALERIDVSRDGRTVTVVIRRFPDLTINFGG